MNAYFKKIIICFCIVGFLFSPLRPQRASAIAVVDDCIVIGGVLITTYAVVCLLEKAGAFDGFDINEDYSSDFRNYLTKKVLALSAAEIAKYFFTAKDSSGQDYVALSDDGFEWNSDNVRTINSPGVGKIPVSTDKTTDNTVKSDSPFMLNGFYMTPYRPVNVDSYYLVFSFVGGDSVTCQLATSKDSSYTVCTFNSTIDGSFKVSQWTSTYVSCFRADSSTNNLYKQIPMTYYSGSKSGSANGKYAPVADGANLYIGYKTTSNTVYVPGDQVVQKDTPIDKPADSVIAVPISGQYSTDDGTTIYNGIDGGVANAVSGLKAQDLSNAGSNTGEGTDTGSKSLTQEAVRDAVRDGVNDSTIGDLDTPSSDVPKLDFSPLYIDITKKFPFCVPFDFINLLSPLQSTAQTPSFHVNFDSNYFYGGGSFDFDFSRFDKLVKVVRYFILLAFVYFLIRKIRAFIGAGGGA